MSNFIFSKYFNKNINDQGYHIFGSDYTNIMSGNKTHSHLSSLKPGYLNKATYGEMIRISQGQNIDISEFGYSLNNDGHRCDEFTKNHNKKDHILFAGDSFTFGEGVPYMKNWSGILYEKYNKKNECSGYFSLGYTGGSIDLIINNIYKYCNLYGDPKFLFILFTEAYRHQIWDNNEFCEAIPFPPDKTVFWKSQENYILSAYNKIFALESFCKKAQIKLFWSFWPREELEIFKNFNLDNFVYYSEDEIYNNIDQDIYDNNKYANIARDGAHPGIIYYSGIANIFWRKYEKTLA